LSSNSADEITELLLSFSEFNLENEEILIQQY